MALLCTGLYADWVAAREAAAADDRDSVERPATQA
jgi:hypothetical protein